MAYGGVDILVSNAGIASSASIEETSLELWNLNMSVLSTGYFLVSRETFCILKRQDTGGAIVARMRAGGADEPVAAFRQSDYRELVANERPASSGAVGGIV